MLSEISVRAHLRDHVPERLPAVEATRYAAVAAVLRYRDLGAPEVLLIRRTDSPADPWSGHMAFPGGRQQPVDRDLAATAVRETREEVGIDLATHGELLGRLDDVPVIGRSFFRDLLIVPFVFVLQAAVEARVAADTEVAAVCWAPLEPMMRGQTVTVQPYLLRGEHVDFPGYQVGDQVVWGLTYRMLQQLFAVLQAPANRW